jgi:Fur family peroxide stress response transcriptional regulator
MREVKNKSEIFRLKCRQAGLKITPQRMAVYDALAESRDHPSAEMVFKKVRKIFPNISLDTVNRTLLSLKEIGLAQIVPAPGGPKRFDGDVSSHQHFKCVKCKRIVDLYYKPFDNIKLPPHIGEKFKILSKNVYLEGVCDLCSKSQ